MKAIEGMRILKSSVSVNRVGRQIFKMNYQEEQNSKLIFGREGK